MTILEAKQILVKHSQFFDLYAKDLYIPRAAETIVNEIRLAYSIINPTFMQSSCSGCGNELIIEANRVRLAYMKETELKAYTFPKT